MWRATRRRGRPDERASLRRLRLLPAFLIACGLALDAFTPPDLSAAPFYSAAPMVASTLLSLRATALIGLTACAADALLTAHYGQLTHSKGQTEVITIATVSLIALLTNRLLRRNDLRLQSARGIAVAVQRAVLPQPPRRVGTLEVAARYEAAEADARLGGDLYSVQETAHGVRCIVGDVRGKGLEAVEAVASLLGTFREAAEHERTIADVVGRLESAMERQGIVGSGPDVRESFVTAVVAEFAPDGSGIRLVNRGHPQPLLLLPDGSVRDVAPAEPALPLGMASLGRVRNRIEALPFPEGAVFLLYTDGVTEARDRDGVFYDPLSRLAGHRFGDPDRLVDSLLADIDRHTGGGRGDDMAILALARPGPGVTPRRS